MSDTAVINSGSDLAAMAPADLFSGTDAAPDTGSAIDASSDTPAELETFETPEPLEADVAAEPDGRGCGRDARSGTRSRGRCG
jgi:hypothetical protein